MSEDLQRPLARRAAAARRGAPPASSAPAVDSLHHPQHPAHRGARRRGAADHRAQCRDDARGDRHRVPRLSARARAAQGRRLPTSRASGCAFRAASPASSSRPCRREYMQHARNPERTVQIGGKATGLRAGLRLALRPRSRQGPPLRHDRGFPQFREARLRDARTSTIRAARCASRSTCRSTSATSRWSMRICG